MFAQGPYEASVTGTMHELVPRFKPRNLIQHPVLDRYLAASLLQKSVRRDAPELAWQAASHLLENHPAYFWKRLPIIGLEDIGLADLDVTMMAILAGTEPALRDRLGGCLKVATALIEIMCAATKDRATDDLYDIVSRSTELQEARADWADVSAPGSLPADFQPGDDVLQRTNCLAAAAGHSGAIPAVGLNKRKWLEAIQMTGMGAVPNAVHETAVAGLLRTGSVLAPMLMAAGAEHCVPARKADDVLFPACGKTEVPVWALGQHTRIGLAGFRKFASRSSRMKRFLSHAMDGSVSKSKVIGALVFRLDCSQLLHRLDWELGSGLKSRATGIGWGIPDRAVPEAVTILRDEFDLVNECRTEALRDYLR